MKSEIIYIVAFTTIQVMSFLLISFITQKSPEEKEVELEELEVELEEKLPELSHEIEKIHVDPTQAKLFLATELLTKNKELEELIKQLDYMQNNILIIREKLEQLNNKSMN